MEYHEQIPGWFDFANIYDHAVRRSRSGAVFVEVGAYLGRSTAYLARRIKESRKKIRLYVVDLWDGWFYDDFSQQTAMREGDDVFWHFMRNMRSAGLDDVLCPLKMDSEKAAALFEDGSVDFAFLDADHGYESVKRDLHAWFPKVKPRGLLAGHDYLNNDFPGVRRAVDEFFFDQQLPLLENGVSFVVFKPGPRFLERVMRKTVHRLVPAGWR
jgi:hypothetical protein